MSYGAKLLGELLLKVLLPILLNLAQRILLILNEDERVHSVYEAPPLERLGLLSRLLLL